MNISMFLLVGAAPSARRALPHSDAPDRCHSVQPHRMHLRNTDVHFSRSPHRHRQAPSIHRPTLWKTPDHRISPRPSRLDGSVTQAGSCYPGKASDLRDHRLHTLSNQLWCRLICGLAIIGSKHQDDKIRCPVCLQHSIDKFCAISMVSERIIEDGRPSAQPFLNHTILLKSKLYHSTTAAQRIPHGCRAFSFGTNPYVFRISIT